MFRNALALSPFLVCALLLGGIAAQADTMHFSVPVSVWQVQLVKPQANGTVECWVGKYSIQPLNATTARSTVKASNYGWSFTPFMISGGSYQGTVNVAVDMGTHSISEARSWYCAIVFSGQYAWGLQHDSSAPYSPESFGNIGPTPNPTIQLHALPH